MSKTPTDFIWISYIFTCKHIFFTFPANYCEMEKKTFSTIAILFESNNFCNKTHRCMRCTRRRFQLNGIKKKHMANCTVYTRRQVEHGKLFSPSFRFIGECFWLTMFRSSEWDGKMWKDRIRKSKQLDSIYLHNKLNTLPFLRTVSVTFFCSFRETNYVCMCVCICIRIYRFIYLHLLRKEAYNIYWDPEIYDWMLAKIVRCINFDLSLIIFYKTKKKYTHTAGLACCIYNDIKMERLLEVLYG